MNLQNIINGIVVKNYKEMCATLEEPILEGNSKITQLKQWSRYFDYEKQGHKFIVKEIYIEPLPEDFSENDVYTKYIQTVLTKYLKVHGDGEFTNAELLKLCGFVNENWNDITVLDKYIKNENITYAQSKYYYNKLRTHVYSYCITALHRCLNRLSKRDFLRWNKVLYIQEEGMKWDEYRLAIDNEYKTYLNVMMKVKNSLGIKYINDYNKDEYYSRLNNLLKENGWNNAYELIKIICADKFIDYMIKESEEEYKEALLKVNDHCLQQMYKYIDVDIENDLKKLVDKSNNKIDIEIARLCYVDEQRQKKKDVIDMYVNIKWHELFDDNFKHNN